MMMRISILLIILIALTSRAQTPETQRIELHPKDSVTTFEGVGHLSGTMSSVSPYYIYGYVPSVIYDAWQKDNPVIPHFLIDPVERPVSWSGGRIIGGVNAANEPGLMGIERGRLGITQTFDNLEITAYGSVDKYGYFGGQTTTLGIGGSLRYHINEDVAITIYGNFYNKNPYLSPAMAGFINSNNFGGYFTFNLGKKWGVDAGVSAVYNPLSRRYEMRPNVTPFYEISPGNKLGIDVGGIMYELLRQNRNISAPVNPTIGPPVPMGAPPVRPHD